MTTKNEYLKMCLLQKKATENKLWYFGMLAILLPSSEPLVREFEVLRRPTGLVYGLEVEGQLVEKPLVDAKVGEAMFHPTTPLEVDATWLPSIEGKITTTFGRLIVNAGAIYPAIGKRIGYVNKPFKIATIESLMTDLIRDDEELKHPDKEISITQYLDCVDRIWFFTKIANLVTVASSEKTVLPSPGSKELRNKLLKDNAGNLSDPVVVAGIVDALDKHDSDYLSSDPAAKHIMDRKAKIGRKKMFQMYGETNDFVSSLGSAPITNTMSEGIETGEEVLPKYMNDLRYASYSRGNSTKLAGYSYKILQRSLSGLEISQTPCNTKKGFYRKNLPPEKIVNRSVLTSKGWSLVTTIAEAKAYEGKELEVRSPMYCTSANNTVCYACLGEIYKGNKNAINNIAAGFSGEMMTLFLKLMHTSGFKIVQIEQNDFIA